jgi:hypothetical protein
MAGAHLPPLSTGTGEDHAALDAEWGAEYAQVTIYLTDHSPEGTKYPRLDSV